jgi:hypothetical protein
MYAAVVEQCVGMADDELDHALRGYELAFRELSARRAAAVAVAQTRGLYRIDEHRTMKAYLRATCNTSDAEIGRQRRLARLLAEFPTVGDAVLAGRVSADHALEIGRILSNPRIARLLGTVVEVLVEAAEHSSFDDFKADIDQFITTTDLDGGFVDIADNVESRNARVDDVGGVLDISASGGDPITALQQVAIFESFVEGEFRRDVETRAAEHGESADEYPLARTAAQRRFDALAAIFFAAAASPQGRALPEPTVHILIDHHSFGNAFAQAAVTLPSGAELELGEIAETDPTLLVTLCDEIVDDPDAFRNRRCETSTGAAIPAFVALQAAMMGQIRRVVVDSQGVVVDLGTKQRLFTGNARLAAQWTLRRSSDQFGVTPDGDRGRAIGGEQAIHRFVELIGIVDADAGGAAQVGEGGEIGVVQAGLPHVVLGGSLLLADLAEYTVVEQHVANRNRVLHGGGELGEILPESAVAGHRHDRGRRTSCCPGSCPGPERTRIAEPDRAEVARHQHALPAGLEVAPERVGVVADVDADHGVGGAVAGERREHCCRRHADA